MKVVMVTNGVLFHQAYLSSCFANMPGISYCCIVSTEMNSTDQKARLSTDLHYKFPIVLALENESSWNNARRLIREADLCIVGAENHKIIKGIDRVYFRCSEHLFKSKFWIIDPKTYLRFFKIRHLYLKESKKSWLLCASSHSKFDFNFYGLYKNRCLKFGYFPEANIGQTFKNKAFPMSKLDTIKIVFVGRSVRWKHPEVAFYVVKKLTMLGMKCSLTFVSVPNKLRNRIISRHMDLFSKAKIKIVDEMRSKDLMTLLAESHLFIFPSGNGEGFGATLYEAMSSGLAVIANAAAGSTKLLVQNLKNGFVYKNKKGLDLILQTIASNPQVLKSLACEAKRFIEEKYSATKAASNLIEFVNSGYSKSFSPDEPISKM